MRILFTKLLDLLYPLTCVSCQKPWNYICKDCKKNIKPHGEICPVCHQYSPDWLLCTSCRSKESYPIEGIIIWFLYEDAIKKLILHLKFQHIHHVSYFLAQLLHYIIITHMPIQKALQNNSLYITYVPSHRTRKHRVKWYNQSEKLAKRVWDLLDGHITRFAKKIRYTRSQIKLNRVKRKTNLIWAFKHIHPIPTIKNGTLLIVDDITTTWSTIIQLAKTIKEKHPDLKIRGAVLARNNN